MTYPLHVEGVSVSVKQVPNDFNKLSCSISLIDPEQSETLDHSKAKEKKQEIPVIKLTTIESNADLGIKKALENNYNIPVNDERKNTSSQAVSKNKSWWIQLTVISLLVFLSLIIFFSLNASKDIPDKSDANISSDVQAQFNIYHSGLTDKRARLHDLTEQSVGLLDSALTARLKRNKLYTTIEEFSAISAPDDPSLVKLLDARKDYDSLLTNTTHQYVKQIIKMRKVLDEYNQSIKQIDWLSQNENAVLIMENKIFEECKEKDYTCLVANDVCFNGYSLLNSVKERIRSGDIHFISFQQQIEHLVATKSNECQVTK